MVLVGTVTKSGLAGLLLLFVLNGATASSDGTSDEGKHLSDVLVEAATDTWRTIAETPHPLQTIKEKYSEQLGRFCAGTLAGYIIAGVVKFLSVSILKATFIAILATVIGASQGWMGKNFSDGVASTVGRLDKKGTTNFMLKKLDLNNDGRVDASDLKELARRIERALLRTNLPMSFGGILGLYFGLFK